MTTEKKLCCGIMLCQMVAILSGVALLYLTAIVYFPSRRELESGIHIDPVMCTTVDTEDIAKLPKKMLEGTVQPQPCDWSTCGEWCLSKGSGICMQIKVMVRDPGDTVAFEDCEEIKEDSCSGLDPENTKMYKVHRCKKGECFELDGVYNCTREGSNDCIKISSAFTCENRKLSNIVVQCTEDLCDPRLNGVNYCSKGECRKDDSRTSYATCVRKCSNLEMGKSNVIIHSTEKVIRARCSSLYSPGNNSVNSLTEYGVWKEPSKVFSVFCTYLTINDSSITGNDCFNGTLFDASKIKHPVTYLHLTELSRNASELAYNNSLWVIKDERSLSFKNDTRLYINTEACSNTLSKECKAFFETHANDGSDGVTPDRFPCYYADHNDEFVVGTFDPDTTRLLLLLFAVIPALTFIISCVCLNVCAKAVGTGNDGHLKLNFVSSAKTEGNARKL